MMEHTSLGALPLGRFSSPTTPNFSAISFSCPYLRLPFFVIRWSGKHCPWSSSCILSFHLSFNYSFPRARVARPRRTILLVCATIHNVAMITTLVVWRVKCFNEFITTWCCWKRNTLQKFFWLSPLSISFHAYGLYNNCGYILFKII